MTVNIFIAFIFCVSLLLLFLLSPIILIKYGLYLRKIYRLFKDKKPLLTTNNFSADFPHYKEVSRISRLRYPIKKRCYSLGLSNAFRLRIKSNINVEIGIIPKVKSLFSSNNPIGTASDYRSFNEKFILECKQAQYLDELLDATKQEILEKLSSYGLISIYCNTYELVAFIDHSALELSGGEFERAIIEPLKQFAAAGTA